MPCTPPINLPKRKLLPSLGTQARDVAALDLLSVANARDFISNAERVRDEREAVGVGDRFSECQPASAPSVDASLLGVRLDICEEYTLDAGGVELRWSQGEVIAVSDGTNLARPRPFRTPYPRGCVMMRWDANEARGEAGSESVFPLLPTKWNPNVLGHGGWRLE